MIAYRHLYEAIVPAGGAGPVSHVRAELVDGRIVTGRVRSLAGAGTDYAWTLELEDYRGDLHLMDCDVVARLTAYMGGLDPYVLEAGRRRPKVAPQLSARARRVLEALGSPYARPYVYREVSGRWRVAHQKAPAGLSYDRLADAYRVAEGCVA